MLNVGIIGIGNTGNQVAALAQERLNIPVLAINSSERDLETIPASIPRKLISDKDHSAEGAGKDRKSAKKYLKASLVNLLTDEDVKGIFNGLHVIFIVSSTGGGTGSGTAPLLANILSSTYRDTKVILIGVLPVNSEAYSAHVNTLDYLDELYSKLEGQTYMLYDNDRLSHLPSWKLLETVNNEIVSDINVIRGFYNTSTRFDSIDDQDAVRLISFPGRIVVVRLEDFKEKDCDNKSIEDMIIEKFKTNCHVETQRDKKVMATGIITNLSESLTEKFNNNVPAVREFSGDPIHAFNHISINEDRKLPNNVYYIMTGLSAVNDKINQISDRIEEIDERQKVMEADNALNEVDLSALTDKISDKKVEDTGETQVNLAAILSKFDV